ncbi:hypothetical protein DFH11DRAFT_1591186, partial [Phellopilus nigrolimitatus]
MRSSMALRQPFACYSVFSFVLLVLQTCWCSRLLALLCSYSACSRFALSVVSLPSLRCMGFSLEHVRTCNERKRSILTITCTSMTPRFRFLAEMNSAL